MEMKIALLTLGALFLAGLVADQIGRKTRLPRVTLLLACGIAVGGSGFDLLPPEVQDWYEFLSVSALTMVAFLLGGSLTVANLLRHGRAILCISGTVVAMSFLVVGGGLIAFGAPVVIALLLAAISTATAPAATQDVIRQSGQTGTFAETLKGIVAIDDAWGLIVFGILLAVLDTLAGNAGSHLLAEISWEIGGALLLGVAIGWPSAILTGRLQPGEPLQAEALGIVFLCAGLALHFDVSFLLAGMTAGAVIVNRAHHHSRAFHEIEHFQWPFMILFFILAGASLEIAAISGIGLIGAAYLALRIVSRIAGGWIGAAIGGAARHERPLIGLALLPQAGVAVGMALVAAERFPEIGETILTVTVATTIVFEILGPAATIYALRRAQRPA